MNFEESKNKITEFDDELTPKENLVNIDNAREIFKMFDDAKITLAGEAHDIIFNATTSGYITEENLEKLLDIINKSREEDE